MMQYRSSNCFLPLAFDDLTPMLSKRPPFLFLDRDGTIVPLADSPKDAVLKPATSELLQKLSRRLSKRVAIVSARGLNSLALECNPADFILAGNYGLEISFPTGRKFLHPAAHAVSTLLSELRFDLLQLARYDSRLLLDDHQFSFCLHVHKVPNNEQHVYRARVKDLEQKYLPLQFRTLPTSYEMVPAIDWSKANALDIIVNELALDASEFLCMSFGDSLADEPMFEWVNRYQGISFSVGQRQSTQARGLLDSPADVLGLLESLLRLD